MLDDIIEMILELILDGMVEAAGSKKVPMPIRIALGAILSLLILALFTLLLYVGISSGSVVLIVIAIVLLLAVVIGAAYKVKAFKSRK